MKNNDNLFVEQEVTGEGSFLSLYPESAEKLTRIDGVHSFVLPMQFGNVYVIRFDGTPSDVRALLCEDMENLTLSPCASLPFGEVRDFCCTPLKDKMNLVVYTEGECAIRAFVDPVIIGRDTDDDWFYPENVGDAMGGENSFADLHWTADQIIDNIYEPLRARFPEYITRELIGYDESGSYGMWAYTFAPEEYDSTLFITADIHGNEQMGGIALGRILQMMCDEEDKYSGLSYLRRRTRLIIIPVVNVWSLQGEQCRANSNGIDLNRDFLEQTQAETKNVVALMKKYKEEISVVMDFHNCGAKYSQLWYQFNIQAENSAVSRKVINHIQERLLAKGYEREADISYVPGKYIKSNAYLQGYAYNELGLSNIVIEHNKSRWYEEGSEQSMLHAVECYGNFMIETARARLGSGNVARRQ
jgi:hypothetical protein